MANKTTEELLHEIEAEKKRYERADAFRAVVRSITEGRLPYVLVEVFNNLNDAVLYIDDALTTQWCNARGLDAIRLLADNRDLGMSDVIGKKCYEAIGLNEPCLNCLAVRAMVEHRTLSNQDFDHQATTQIKHLEVVAVPVLNGIRGCFEIIRDFDLEDSQDVPEK